MPQDHDERLREVQAIAQDDIWVRMVLLLVLRSLAAETERKYRLLSC